ncbi:MAG: hypothetical protein A4E72_01545 [Syntrophus sp. PtaU1.Bin208]|nr:MAG: hypothetical protein A4E72_01545 [Syntrophus sp. PtaU1.Bin208]
MKLQNESVSRISGIINHLINRFLVQNILWDVFRRFESLGEKRTIAGILNVDLALLDDEVIESLHLSIAEPSCRFGMVLGHALKKLINRISAQRLKIPITTKIIQLLQKETVTVLCPLLQI